MTPAGSEVRAVDLLGYDDPSQAPESTGVEKLTLKKGDFFAVTNRLGDIAPAGARDLGFFREDTRFLSHLKLTVQGGPAVCLSTQTSTDYVTQIDLTVTGHGYGGVLLGDPVHFLHLRREQLVDGEFVDRYVLTNFVVHPIDFWIELEYGADFADIFEIRGWRRPERGSYLVPEVGEREVTFRYRGRDGRHYRTELRFEGRPARLDASRARFEFHLEPNESTEVELRVFAAIDEEGRPAARAFEERAARSREEFRAWGELCTRIDTDNGSFDAALARGIADLRALGSTRGGRPVIAAGIPWYTCPFGRDTLLTAYQALLVNPELAREALVYLAAHQGTKLEPERDEEPGKIFHELRTGEMARAGEVPHTPYYGSVDATPLWIVLLAEYYRWTGDRTTIEELLPAAERAVRWIDEYGDLDGDGFVEYARKTEKGLLNQGWKDSHDGVVFADGRVAVGPIALVEVQGYVCDAKRRLGNLYRRLGDPVRGDRLVVESRALARRIEERFWMPEQGYFAEALDGEKRQVDSITTNPGHLLWSRAVSLERARAVGEVLLSPRMFSGWGIRTLASRQPSYNPLSYHNGTIWPHDNAICAMGLSIYGMEDGAVRVLDALYQASLHFRHQRLPELFCGMGRRQGDFPVHYPVACSPQAWASATFFLLLRACLGLFPDAPHRTLHVRNPRLPPWLDEVHLRNLSVGGSRLDLHFSRTREGIFTAVGRVEGPPLRVRIGLG